MTTPLPSISTEALRFGSLIDRFATRTAGVREVIAVAPEGSLIARSANLELAAADRLAAITSALVSLAGGVGRLHDLGTPRKVVVDLDQGYLLVRSAGSASSLGALAGKDAHLGDLAYDLAILATRAASFLTPALAAELRAVART